MKVNHFKVAALSAAIMLSGCGWNDDDDNSSGNSSSSSSSSSSSASTSSSSTSSTSSSSSSSSSSGSSSSSSSSSSGGTEAPRYIKLFEDNFESGSLSKWTTISLASDKDWITETYAGDKFAVANCYQGDAACDDWMISPEIDLTNFTSAKITFNSAWNYGNNSADQMKLMVSDDYAGDPATATWTDITESASWSGGAFEFVDSGDVSLTDFVGKPVVVAFHYVAPVPDAAKWEIDDILIDGMGTGDFPLDGEITLPDETFYANRSISFNASAFNGAGEPFTYEWDFGDNTDAATGSAVAHTFANPGEYQVTLTITDNAQTEIDISKFVTVETQSAYSMPAKQGDFRVATFNAGFDPFKVAGGLKAAFDNGDYVKAQKVAEIIQRTNADVLLLNEIDGNDNMATINSFSENYLKVSQNGAGAITYDYIYTNDCNTGVPSGFDLNNDGSDNTADDAYGFGEYPGKYCMAVFSKYPLDETNARTFQLFKWKDMPGALEPELDGEKFYSAAEWEAFRLSSKTHMDVPVTIGGKTIHILGSHPTPPTFDAEEDRNGKRNADEIRLWADYIDPAKGGYLYDDNNSAGVTLNDGDMFIIVGDENASSVEGDAYIFDDDSRAIDQLLDSPYVNPNLREDSANFQVPTSVGGAENSPANLYGTSHTAGWAMRADYVLPSAQGMRIKQNGVFWPRHSDNLHYLVEAVDATDVESSDHRLVWMDLEFFDGKVVDPETQQPAADKTVIFEDSFTGTDLAGWTVIDNGEASLNWQQSSYSGVNYAAANCYKGAEACDDWMLRELDLSSASNAVLSFRNAYKYGKNSVEQISVLVATDYNGDVASASWVELSDKATWSSGEFAWADSGEIDLSAYDGQTITLAFHYSTEVADAASWEITDIKVESDLAPYAEDDFSQGIVNWTAVSTTVDGQDWVDGSANGSTFAKVSCYQGTAACDDWLVRTVDLSKAVNPVLNFDNASNYGDDPRTQIALMVSANYSGDVTTTQWTNLSAKVNWTEGKSWTFVNSGDIDLSEFVGANLTIAFHYTSVTGKPSSTWEIANFSVVEAQVQSGDTKGGTVLADVGPGDVINTINERQTGELAFSGIAPPADATEENQILASSAATLDGNAIAGFGYTTLAKSGQLVDGNVYAQVNDKFGTPLFVSNYNEFTSFITRGDRLFAISQYENIPGGMSLSELQQDATTGQLSMISTRAIDFADVHGGYNHCAAMVTPWDTHLGSEEYEPDYRLRSAATGEIDSYYNQIGDYHSDLALTEINPYWYGYAVEVDIEIDGDNVTDTVTKHYAMGRLAIELAYAMPDEKTVYLTDDGTNGGLFLFIADVPTDLSSGSLYAMKWNQTAADSADNAGMGAADIEWLPMGHATDADIKAMIEGDTALTFDDIFSAVAPTGNQCMLGYTSINHKGTQECLKLNAGMELAASRLETRRYAAYLGATVEMRKEEGITYNPHNHKMYLAISDIDNGMLAGNSADVGGPDHMKIGTKNDCGGLYEMSLGSNAAIGSDYVVGAMTGLIAGVPEGSQCDIDNLAGPDNVAYIGYNTLIITEDTDDHDNNFVWAYDLNAKSLTRIFSAPSGAENTGPYMFNDINGFSYISTVVQHPAGESVDPQPGNEAEIGYFGPIPAPVLP
ncbi:choice-of-anchor J domain-containing protein [Teredinibacter turnerae]|uniref:choice-of-anchor J domain-containing protein n=1 Tax=Teredinibacter turnerae TaxID=2426 RepID=UPI0030D076AF